MTMNLWNVQSLFSCLIQIKKKREGGWAVWGKCPMRIPYGNTKRALERISYKQNHGQRQGGGRGGGLQHVENKGPLCVYVCAHAHVCVLVCVMCVFLKTYTYLFIHLTLAAFLSHPW